MILLDTNVISELMRLQPNVTAIEWLDEQFSDELFISAIAILDNGKRKQSLLQAAEIIFKHFTLRCLPFDKNTTPYYAAIIAYAKIQGRPMSVEGTQIAAIALQNKALLATRNTTDFDFLEDLTLINPWLK